MTLTDVQLEELRRRADRDQHLARRAMRAYYRALAAPRGSALRRTLARAAERIAEAALAADGPRRRSHRRRRG